MVFNVQDKVALVTGGTEGTGLAVVEELLSRGCRGIMIANRNENVAAEVLRELAVKHGEGRARFAKMDLNDFDSVKAAFRAAVDAFGTCEIVFANAGYGTEGSFLDNDDSVAISAVNGNLLATMLLAKSAVNHWLRTETPGVFVANSSLGGAHGIYRRYALPGYCYQAAKAGTIAFCTAMQGDLEARAWSAGLDRSPIRTGVVCPGAVWTPIMSKLGFGATPEEAAATGYWRRFLPMLGGWTPMEAVVAAVLKLIEDEECRGTTFVVSGEGGEAREYPKDADGEDYVSRGSRPGSPTNLPSLRPFACAKYPAIHLPKVSAASWSYPSRSATTQTHKVSTGARLMRMSGEASAAERASPAARLTGFLERAGVCAGSVSPSAGCFAGAAFALPREAGFLLAAAERAFCAPPAALPSCAAGTVRLRSLRGSSASVSGAALRFGMALECGRMGNKRTETKEPESSRRWRRLLPPLRW
ncbi:hypothetical protein DFJ74DRAFT_707780 [Hyaloraphidium curvatum]|nr:hypothetical protein DFJ74DRAFT_707780 [Hyaloraphidium curvatum]